METPRLRPPLRSALFGQLRRIWRSAWCSGASREVSHMHERQLRDIGLTRNGEHVKRRDVDPPSRP